MSDLTTDQHNLIEAYVRIIVDDPEVGSEHSRGSLLQLLTAAGSGNIAEFWGHMSAVRDGHDA